MTDHIKGPWRVHPTDEILVIDRDRVEVAEVEGDYDNDYEALAARAELIAKAPELLRLLTVFATAYADAADPIGDSDLDNEQTRHVTVTLGDCRRASALLGIHPKVRA